MELTTEKLARMIDHSKLQPHATEQEIIDFCKVVRRYKFVAAFVLPANLSIARSELAGNGFTKLGTGIGFPFGTHTTKIKILECEEAIALGAEELDMVMNIGALKSGNFKLVRSELESVLTAIGDIPLKAILEVSYLTPQEIREGARICCDTRLAFVKTGTGFGTRATTMEDVRLITEVVGGRIGVKVAGGVQNISTLLDMHLLGVTRFGVSRGDRIIEEFNRLFKGCLVI